LDRGSRFLYELVLNFLDRTESRMDFRGGPRHSRHCRKTRKVTLLGMDKEWLEVYVRETTAPTVIRSFLFAYFRIALADVHIDVEAPDRIPWKSGLCCWLAGWLLFDDAQVSQIDPATLYEHSTSGGDSDSDGDSDGDGDGDGFSVYLLFFARTDGGELQPLVLLPDLRAAIDCEQLSVRRATGLQVPDFANFANFARVKSIHVRVAYFVSVLCTDLALPATAFADSLHGLDSVYAVHFGAVAAVAAVPAAVSTNPACADLLASIFASVPAAALIEQL
jgi:hypothetical protein